MRSRCNSLLLEQQMELGAIDAQTLAVKPFPVERLAMHDEGPSTLNA
jgi:hypothetical protein